MKTVIIKTVSGLFLLMGLAVKAPTAFAQSNVGGKAEQKYRLVFQDDFSGKALDPKHWEIIHGNGCPALCGFGNQELQYYTGSADNLKIADGFLTLTARHQKQADQAYTSAKITTKPTKGWQYGKISVRAKLPTGLGTWPAIWMLPQNNKYGGWPKSGEIDIMEHVGYDQGVVHGTVHTESFNHLKNTQKAGTISLPRAHEQFHTYTLEWTANRLTWLVDGKAYYQIDKKPSDTADEWPFDHPYHLIINLAVGGGWGGKKGVNPRDYPAQLVIDWVKVWQPTL